MNDLLPRTRTRKNEYLITLEYPHGVTYLLTHASAHDDGAAASDVGGAWHGDASRVRCEGISHTRSSHKIPMRAWKTVAMIHRGQNRKYTDDQVGVNE